MQNYQKAILQDKVPISTFDIIMFYASGLIGLLVGLFAFYSLNFRGLRIPQMQSLIGNSIILLLIAFVSYGTKNIRNIFRLSFLPSLQSKEVKEKLISNLSISNKWTLLEKDVNYYRFEDAFRMTKWSNYITIIFDNKGFYINVLDSRWKPIDFGVSKRMTKKIEEQILGCSPLE